MYINKVKNSRTAPIYVLSYNNYYLKYDFINLFFFLQNTEQNIGYFFDKHKQKQIMDFSPLISKMEETNVWQQVYLYVGMHIYIYIEKSVTPKRPEPIKSIAESSPHSSSN